MREVVTDPARTRRGIRTRNLRALNATPLPVGLPGRGPTENRTLARVACKATLCTSTQPEEPTARLELATSRLRGGCTSRCASPAEQDGRALDAIRTRTGRALDPTPLPVGLRGRSQARIRTSIYRVQSAASCRLDDLRLGRRAPWTRRPGAGREEADAPVRFSGASPTPTSGRWARSAEPCPPRRAYGCPCAGCSRRRRQPC